MDAIDRQQEFQVKTGASSYIHRYSRTSCIIFLAIVILLLLGSVSFGASLEDIHRWEKSKDVKSLIPALGDKYSDVREAAAKALENLGEPLGG